MKREDIVRALAARGPEQESLFERARKARAAAWGGRVEARSVVEYANLCRQECNYCGMSRRSGVARYVLAADVFLRQVRFLYEQRGRRVLMVQAGECETGPYFDALCDLLRTVKRAHPQLVLIASLGSLSEGNCQRLRDAGVERYLLKFETSDPALYRTIKPSDTLEDRLARIRRLKDMGFQVSSGNITGLPGQSLESVADDILLLRELDIPMGSTSVFIPNEQSAYAGCGRGDIDTALNFTAVLRIVCPRMLIPTTSSLELAGRDGQFRGLMAGANTVTLHDGTPGAEEDAFVIYSKERYKPKDIMFDVVRRAGLECPAAPLI